jgi:hypothetical protein
LRSSSFAFATSEPLGTREADNLGKCNRVRMV